MAATSRRGPIALVAVLTAVLAVLASGAGPVDAVSARASSATRITATATAATATATAADPAGWTPLATFDDYADGSLRGQGPWSVNTTGAADGAIAANAVPADLSGKAEIDQLSGFDEPIRYRGDAYAALGDSAVPAGSTSSLFLQFQATDLAHTDLHLGLSADATPGLGMDTTSNAYDLDDFGPEVSLGAHGLVARDGATDRPLTGLDVAAGSLYRLWLVVDNAAHTYRVYAAGPTGDAVALSSGGVSDFAFRTATDAPLVTFLQLNDDVDIPSADTYLDTITLAGSALTTDPAPRFTSTSTFDDLATGPLGSRGGWSSSDASVIADPAPYRTGNRVLRVEGTHGYADHAVDPIRTGTTGTLFFRMRRAGAVNVSTGLTDVAQPTTYSDYRVQSGSTDGYHYAVRDGAGTAQVGTAPVSDWQCFWLVADHDTDRVTAYSRGGPYRTLTRLPAGAMDDYGFRTPTNGSAIGDLDRFVTRTDAAGPVLLDDVALDPDHADLAVPGGDSRSCVFHGPAADVPVKDPAPGVGQSARLRLGLTKVAQLPSGTPRVNFTSTMPGTTTATDRLMMPDLSGTLFTTPAGGATAGKVTPYLDVADYFPDFVTSPSLGTGLGFVAFAPDFARSGIFYTVHTEAGNALTTQTPTLNSPSDARVQGVITQWTATDPSAPTFSGTHRQVLRIGFSQFTHGIQQISFDPLARPGDEDYGLLYVGVGDGDETPVFSPRPQSLAAPQGKLLRIDPAHPSGDVGYTVPADNPFVHTAGALGEIYALGLRNPHRFSWDPVSGRMFLGNIGEKRVDSLYQVLPGDNFGWNVREGHFRFDPTDPTNVYPLPADDHGFTYPVLQIGRDAGVALVAGFAYDGKLAALRGHYLFGDIVTGLVHETQTGLLRRGGPEPAYHAVQLSVGGHLTTMRDLVHSGRVDLRFGQDASGELYLSSKADGTVWKVTSAQDVTPAISSCRLGSIRLHPAATTRYFKPKTPKLWRIGHGQVRLTRPGSTPSGPIRPHEYAVLHDGPQLSSFDATAQVRIDRSPQVLGRDVVFVIDYRDATHFSYVHLSNDTTSYAHNGIFVVDGSDRRRVDDQWTGLRSARAAISDKSWHKLRVRQCGSTGEVAVYLNGARTPLMTATDASLTSGGRLGFGSFDDYGRLRDLRVHASAVKR